MKTLYLFYLNDKTYEKTLEPVLYAYTENEELFERFLETRKKSKFTYVTRELTKDQLLSFKSQYSQQQLGRAKFKTKNDSYPNYISHIEIVCTWGEEQSVILQSDYEIFEKFRKVVFNPVLFNRKIQIDLYKLGFFTIYQWLYNMMYVVDPLDYPEYSGVFNKDGNMLDRPLKAVDMVVDEFQVFMDLYGATMKDG